jgi:diguanylate cyclase (GGDEF)-like protein
VARFGGDEFVVVLSGLQSAEGAAVVAEKCRSHLAAPLHWDGKELIAGTAPPPDGTARELRISASIGVAIFPHDGADSDALLLAADSAMYRAKAGGNNRVHMASAPKLVR